MNEFIARFTFQENNSPLNASYDSIKKLKLYHLSQPVTKKCHKVTIAEDENESFGETFACFNNQTLNLCQIMNWPVTINHIPYVLKMAKQIQSLYFGTSYSHCVQ